jgi:hypothetical protein
MPRVAPVGDRRAALLALTVPVLAGVAYQAAFNAPGSYSLIGVAALALGLSWIALAPPLSASTRVVPVILLAILALPLLTGPEVNDVQRWLPLGPVTLHAGMLAIPLLLRMTARDEADAPIILSTALLLALLQPDAGSAAALTFGTVGLYHVRPDWKLGAIIAVGFFVIIFAALRGELAPQPFVERVLLGAIAAGGPALALGLFASLLASFLLMLFALGNQKAERFAIGGTLFGFAIMSMVNTYPMPLIGFGAAPILGYALALAPSRREAVI